MPTPLKFLLPLCLLVACLASAPPLPASPGGAPRQEDALREWVETRLQHLERRLLLQEEAALATAKQERRLLELETEVERLRKEREAWINDAQHPIIATAERKKEEVRETGDRYVSMAGSGFTALGVMAAIVTFLGYFSYTSVEKEAASTLKKMEQMRTEMDALLKTGREKVQSLNDLLEVKQNKSPNEEFSEDIVRSAKEVLQKGVGPEVLRGMAVLAQNKEDWSRACQYWEAVLQQSPNDDIARFNLAQCQIFWACSDTVTPQERQENFKKAENCYIDMLRHQHALSPNNKIATFMSYARLKRLQASYATDLQERNRLRKEAEPHLQEAHRLAPWDRNILTLLSALRLDQARDATPEERTHLLDEAEGFLKGLSPWDAPTVLYNRACIAALRGQPKEALDFLEQSRKAGTLPSREDIEKDKDMDSLRQREDFKAFLQRAWPESKGEK